MSNPEKPDAKGIDAHQSGPFRWQERMRSFRFAGQGLAHAFRVTHNFRIHAALSLAAVGLGIWLGIGYHDWAVVILCIGLVSALEVANTAVEELVDLLHPHQDPRAGRIKDLAAGAVLVASCAAALVGLLVLGPPLWQKLFA